MTKTRDFLAKRQSEVRERLDPLLIQRAKMDREIELLERELKDIRSAAEALGMVNRLQKDKLGVTRREEPNPTIKAAALEVLKDFPDGLIALDILAKINERYGWTVVRSSLSPQLSRLKGDGKLVTDGTTWRLPPTPNHNPTYR